MRWLKAVATTAFRRAPGAIVSVGRFTPSPGRSENGRASAAPILYNQRDLASREESAVSGGIYG